MLDCTYFLYKALLKRFPYIPSPETEYAVKKLEQLKALPDHIPGQSQYDMLKLLDCAEALADDRAGYAFLLGLDTGLSIAREGRQLQGEW